jgi:hypothetical protein
VSAEVTASRNNVYLDEEFQLTISVNSTGVSLDPNFQLASMPDQNKLILGNFHELPMERRMQGNQLRENRRFTCSARALVSGTIEIAPILRASVIRGLGFFRQVSQFNINVKPLSLNVIPLPSTGKPSSFSGAVGQFGLDVEVTPMDVAVGDLITVSFQVRGKGYMEKIAPLSISPGPHFKAYPSKLIPGKNTEEKVFEHIIVPQSTNAVAIPAAEFSFFDPYAASYKSLSTGPFHITFHPQKKATSDIIYTPARQATSASTDGGKVVVKTEKKGCAIRSKIAIISLYWSTVLALAFWMSIKLRKGALFTIILLLAAVILFLPFHNRIELAFAPFNETTAVKSDKARLAPGYSALVTFDVPRNSVVTLVETHGTWAKIRMGDKKGWIPAEALEALSDR